MIARTRRGNPAPRRLWAALGLLIIASQLAACGPATEQLRVRRRFEAYRDCDAESVARTVNGYVVRGCGMEAQYVCAVRDPSPFLGGGARSSCVEVGVRLLGPERAPTVARVVAEREDDGTLVLSASTLVRGGRVTYLAQPGRFPDQALIRLFVSARRDVPEGCVGHLWLDGEPLPTHQQSLEAVDGGVLYSLLVDLDALDGFGAAERAAARVCSTDVTFTLAARGLARTLAIRAREEASALGAASAGSRE